MDNGGVSFADASPHKRLQLMLDTLNAGKPEGQALTTSQVRKQWLSFKEMITFKDQKNFFIFKD